MKAVSELIDGVSTNLLFFDNRRSFEEFALNPLNSDFNSDVFKEKVSYFRNNFTNIFFGSPPAKSFEELMNHNSFLGEEIYLEQKQKVKKMLRKIENLGQLQEIPNKKLKFNDLGLGVFCFPRAAVALRKHKRPNGDIKIVSDVRDVYAYFPKSNDDNKLITLYQIVAHSASTDASKILYNGITTGLITEYLIENGFDVEVFAVFGSFHNKVNCGSVVKVKNATDEMSINSLMLLISDPRYYRTKVFFSVISSFSYFFRNISDGLGEPKPFENAAKIFIEQYRKTDTSPIVVRSCTNEQSVLAEINRILGIVKNA